MKSRLRRLLISMAISNIAALLGVLLIGLALILHILGGYRPDS